MSLFVFIVKIFFSSLAFVLNMSKSVVGPKTRHRRIKTKNQDELNDIQSNSIHKSTEKMQIQLFKDKISLPKFTTDPIVRILFASCLLTKDWKTVMQTLYEIPSFNKKMNTKEIEAYAASGMSQKHWDEISSFLSESDLKREESGALEKSDECLKMFSDCISESLGNDSKLEPLTLAKAYLITYSSDYRELLNSVLPSALFNTRKAFNSFLKNNSSPQTSSLCTIFEYLK